MSDGDRRVIWAMVLVPSCFFTLTALVGHLGINADNMLQNYPLRVLSGQQLATGHLPLINPYADSGTPLLGGLNAGALYPLTVIFAFIPPLAAWVINLVAVYVTAGLGMFSLLRWHGLRTRSAATAAFTFSYAGSMVGQAVHLGVIQGFSFLPWMTLALLSLGSRLRASTTDEPWWSLIRTTLPSVVAFALLWGLSFLTGEPRAIAEMELLAIIVVPMVLFVRSSYSLDRWRLRLVYLASTVVGLLWGVAIGLVQLLPGQSFINLSQRSVITYSFFGAGSLPIRWTPLLLIQDLFGGNGALGQARYFLGYNLPEVTGYVGVVALVATIAYFVQWWRHPRDGNRDFVLYAVIGLVGLFATWGQFTFMGHLFHMLPVYGHVRLPSRNIVLVDFAATCFLGWWLDRLEVGDLRAAGLLGRRRWIIVGPAIAVGLLAIATIGWGPAIVNFVGTHGISTAPMARHEVLSLVLHLIIAVSVALVVLRWSHFVHAMRWLVTVLIVDVLIFLLFCNTSLVSGNTNPMPSSSQTIAVRNDRGRFALVDATLQHYAQMEALGFPNLNVFTKLPSVQGYGALISNTYNSKTNTHPMFSLDPCFLASGGYAQLRLATVAISTLQLATVVGEAPGSTTSCGPARSTPTTWRYFGQELAVSSVVLRGISGSSVATSAVRVQLLDASGRRMGQPIEAQGSGALHFSFANKTHRAAGFVVSAASDLTIGDARVTTIGSVPVHYDLESAFQHALSTSSWHLTSVHDTIAVFQSASVRAPDWLAGPSQGSSIRSIRDASWGDSWVTLHATAPTTLVRSFAYLPGWRASAVNTRTGQHRDLLVRRDGLVQRVRVPAGTWTVHFHYHAPYIETGLIGSTLSVFGWLVLTLVMWRRSLRARNGTVEP